MNFYSMKAKDIRGEDFSFDALKDKVVLIVNTASQCGFTHQYEGLQRLYEYYGEDGFVVLGFPCNQFGNQEPGENKEILSFVETHFGINFPMFSKIFVNGEETHALYKYLKSFDNQEVLWNFEKYLLDREGNVVEHYLSDVEPRDLMEDINDLI
ncbi:glutathione peroxidase [Peptoniphilus sp. KCTC 25270]|uniref:glutathione peroxidase n=1 Tax=Peptoniphilus sp. KCTC 25270 TaxID=2897414 RepID=UPI001E36BDBC|nr:glutathione peroxidase [Peptoniphilus sp. KCTC 25270]MCD1146932.1 glutathione peroxidase [Peptoniphilus sp. KCTC 25270]